MTTQTTLWSAGDEIPSAIQATAAAYLLPNNLMGTAVKQIF